MSNQMGVGKISITTNRYAVNNVYTLQQGEHR